MATDSHTPRLTPEQTLQLVRAIHDAIAAECVLARAAECVLCGHRLRSVGGGHEEREASRVAAERLWSLVYDDLGRPPTPMDGAL